MPGKEGHMVSQKPGIEMSQEGISLQENSAEKYPFTPVNFGTLQLGNIKVLLSQQLPSFLCGSIFIISMSNEISIFIIVCNPDFTKYTSLG